VLDDVKDGEARLVLPDEGGGGVVFALMLHDFKGAAIEVERLALVVLLHADDGRKVIIWKDEIIHAGDNKKVSSEATQLQVLVVVGIGDHLCCHFATAYHHLHYAAVQSLHAALPLSHALISLHLGQFDLHFPAFRLTGRRPRLFSSLVQVLEFPTFLLSFALLQLAIGAQ
jgi:hypothetical protein